MGFALRLYEYGDEEDGFRTWVGHEVEAICKLALLARQRGFRDPSSTTDIEPEVGGRDRACEMRW